MQNLPGGSLINDPNADILQRLAMTMAPIQPAAGGGPNTPNLPAMPASPAFDPRNGGLPGQSTQGTDYGGVGTKMFNTIADLLGGGTTEIGGKSYTVADGGITEDGTTALTPSEANRRQGMATMQARQGTSSSAGQGALNGGGGGDLFGFSLGGLGSFLGGIF